MRVSGSSNIFLVLYVEDILLASNDSDLLIETKHMLSTPFDMKDLGEASYVLGIKILRDRANGVLILSQRAYIERILKRFNMHNCKSTKAPIVKGDKFSKAQCPQNDDEREEMRVIPYSSFVDMCSISIRDSATFPFYSLNKIELYINMFGARSTPSVLRESNSCKLLQNNFSGLEMESTTPKAEIKFRIHIA